MKNTPTLIPTMQYHDANKAVIWLCEVFGFQPKIVFKDDQENVQHAELIHGIGLIMVGPRSETPFGKLIQTPQELNGAVNSCIYVVVEDADAHYQKAKAGGAEIVLELVEQSYGGKDYTCKDFEGYLWSFGTYDPFAEEIT